MSNSLLNLSASFLDGIRLLVGLLLKYQLRRECFSSMFPTLSSLICMENFVSLKISEEKKKDSFYPLAGSIRRAELIFFFVNKFEIL